MNRSPPSLLKGLGERVKDGELFFAFFIDLKAMNDSPPLQGYCEGNVYKGDEHLSKGGDSFNARLL